MNLGARGAATLFAALGLAACGRDRADPGSAAPAGPSEGRPASATAPGSATPRPAPAYVAPGGHPGALRTPTAACRALTVKGSATLGDRPLVTGGVLDGSAWLRLGDAAEVSIKHATTGREVTLRGPALALACADGEERFLMPEGELSTTPTQGARPGAEVLIGTPLGAVRYGDARLTVRAGTGGLTVSVAVGSAWVDAPDPGSAPQAVAAGRSVVRSPPALDASGLVARCEAAAGAAEARAREVLAPARPASSGSSPLGERASAHVQARRAARSACAVAHAGLGALAGGPARAELEGRLSAANAAWRGVPSLREARPPAPAQVEPPAPGESGKVESR